MTSTEKKMYKKNKAIKTLSVLLFISLLANGFFSYQFIKNNKSESVVTEVGDSVNEIVVTESENDIDNGYGNRLINKIESDLDKSIREDLLGEYSDSTDQSAEDTIADDNNEYLLKTKDDCYDVIYKQLVEGTDEISLWFEPDNVFWDDVEACYKRILDDHPELFWLNGGSSSQGVYEDGLFKYKTKLTTRIDLSNVDKMKEELDKAVNEIVVEANKYETEYEKALYVHDRLVNDCEYDYDNYMLGQTKGEEYVNQLVYTAYGCLVNNKSVCAGYANAYNLVMKRLGIECGIISGVGYNSLGVGRHAWNYIKIDDEYYLVDVTWDDPVYEGDYVPTEISHEYFCITNIKMNEDHVPNEGEFVPEATSEKYMQQ